LDLYSPSWYRVAEMRPRLRAHVRIHRHHYRGELWYVLEDLVSRKVHRFNPVAHYLIGLMDGRRTVQEIWDGAIAKFGDDAPTQEEMIRLLGQLHSSEVLQSEVTPDLAELMRRARKAGRKTWFQNLISPLSIKIPLVDPDRGLQRWLPYYEPLFGWFGLLLWFSVVGLAAFSGVSHWNELTDDITSRVLAPQNLLIMWITFPLLKLVHEFGHACATKAWGGEVHEMGVMLLVMMPIPYCDASASSAFRETHRRAIVGAAGMIVEVFVAAIAVLLWIETAPGLVRAVLYNVILIAGISTVVFNANPLLRYDGYYILADLIQIPNLRARANQYLTHLMEKRLFGLKLPEFEATTGEKQWFVFFAIASFFYRMFVVFAIALFIATQYFIVGIVLALWAIVTSVLYPIVKGIGYLFLHPKLRRHRIRALSMMGGIVVAIVVAVCFVPVPLWSRAEGVIWVPDEAQVRAGADGFLREVVATPGQQVSRGSTLIIADDPSLGPRTQVLEAQLRLLQVRAQSELFNDKVRWEVTREEIQATRAELEHVQRQIADLTVVSPTSGIFVLLIPVDDLPDRYVRKGQSLGYVLPPATVSARVLVSQDEVDMVRSRTERVEVKLAGRIYDTYEAGIRREIPAASNKFSNLALSSVGGGRAPVDPSDSKEPKALTSWFEFEIEMPATNTLVLGEHVYVRFEHGAEPVAWRVYRSVRQLFMRQFVV